MTLRSAIITGTANININGTVGATTPTTGAFTTVTASAGSGVRAILVSGGSIASFYDASAVEQARIQANTTNLIIGTINTNPVSVRVNSTEVGLFSTTGLAVTGVLTTTGTISPQQATTAGAPAYVKGAIYFDTTLNKLRVGGATAWETITSV